MPVYTYKAKSLDGKDIKGTMEANDRVTIINLIKEKGYFPIQVNEQSMFEKKIDISFGQPVKLKDIAIFCRQFATIINAGIPVLNCLDILREQTENKVLRKITKEIYDQVQIGSTLSIAMKEHKVFPSLLLNMVEAGEVSGSLDIALQRMALHYEKENKMKQKIQSAMIYPIIISIIAVIVVNILVLFVVPNFVTLFDGMGMELPLSTKIILLCSNIMKKYWYIIIAALVVVIIFLTKYLSSEIGKNTFASIKLKLPVFGLLNKKIVASRFTRTLSTLLSSGLPLLTAIEIVSKVVDNILVAKGLERVRQEVSRGVSLSQPIALMGVFPPMVVNMIRIGEDTGSLESILEKTANFYDDEVETAITQMTALLEPVIICVMAIVVGFIIISIVQPMFGMFSGIGEMGN